MVSREQAMLDVNRSTGRVSLTSLSRAHATSLQGAVLQPGVAASLAHGDLFTIGGRTFRWEFPNVSPQFCCYSRAD